MNNNISGIYCIENIINNKKYIGQSINIHKRWNNHKSELRKNKHGNVLLQRAWNKYGENNFKFYVLKECNIDELDDNEIFYIDLYDTVNNGYNISLGGNSNKIVSKETRRKLSEAMKKCYSENRFNFSFVPRKILQIDYNGNIVNEWMDVPENIVKTNPQYDATSIRRCLMKEFCQHCGYFWVYEDDYKNFDIEYCIENKKIEIKPVYQYDFDGNFIFKWDKPKDAEIKGFNRSMISAVCNGIKKSHSGYIWSYKELTKEEVMELVNEIPLYIRNRNTPDKKAV